jgi:hypothetical protein
MRASSRLSVPTKMRASIGLCLQASSISLLLLSAGGCTKEVKAEFPRPPATATLPPPAEEPENLPPAPVPVEPEVVEPIESPGEVEEEGAEKPADVPPKPTQPAPLAEEEPEDVPPSTTLVGAGEVDPELASKLERASSLLDAISRRNLTSDQADQLVAARGFVAGARQAISDGDPRRALVLIDKGLILAEDVDRLSRP